MKHILLAVCLFAVLNTAYASIDPLVVTSEFHNQNWFPLPEEQMKSAAIDTALMRLSESGRFAFLYATDSILANKAGSLKLAVSLVEPAESAKISIHLNLPGNRGSYVSSSAVSLRGKDYQGIFNALQQLGKDGAEQLATSLGKTTDKDENADIRNQIIDLNLHVIKLGGSISQLQQTNHNKAITEQLGKLDTIIDKLDVQHAYAKQSDAVKNQKLDAIYAEIKKLNIGSNTDNKPPSSDELSDYDIEQLPKLKKARELKYAKNFDNARTILKGLSSDSRLSPGFRGAIIEELNINLPLYEAEIVKNDLSVSFMQYRENNEYKNRISYIHRLYDSVLAQDDIALETRVNVNRKKDELNITGDSMDTVNIAVQASSLANMRMSLRNEVARHNMMRAMGMKGSGNDDCPDRQTIEKLMKQASLSNPIVSYGSHDDSCELVLEENNNQQVVFLFSEEDSSYEHRKQ